MNSQRVIGIVLLAVGVILFVMGMNGKDSVADQWTNFFSGHYTNATVWYIIGGAASAIAGLGMLTFGGRKAIA